MKGSLIQERQKMRMLNLITLVVFGWGSGCGTQGDYMPDSAKSFISGVASYSPGYDGEIVFPPVKPEDTAARPLPEAYIALMTAPRIDLRTQEIVVSTITDSTGTYSIEASPGEYLLVVSAPNINALVISERSTDSTFLPTKYNALYEVHLKPGGHLQQDIHLSEISLE
jgi:hypothetical protein